MKTLHPKLSLVAVVSLSVIMVVTVVLAAERKQARVTEVIRDVRLLSGQAAGRPAVVNDCALPRWAALATFLGIAECLSAALD